MKKRGKPTSEKRFLAGVGCRCNGLGDCDCGCKCGGANCTCSQRGVGLAGLQAASAARAGKLTVYPRSYEPPESFSFSPGFKWALGLGVVIVAAIAIKKSGP